MPVFPPRRSPSPIFSDYMVEDEVSSQPPRQPQYPPHQYHAESQDNELVTVRGRTFLNINSKRPLSESLSRRSSRDSGISSAGSDNDGLVDHTHPQQTHVHVQGGSTRASPVLVIQPRERASSGSGSGSQSGVGVGAGIGMRIRSALNERPRLRLITPSILGTTTSSPSQANQVRFDTTVAHGVNLKQSESHHGTSPTRSYQSHTHSSKSATSLRSNSNGIINTLNASARPNAVVSFQSPSPSHSNQLKAQPEEILEDMEAGISASPPTTSSTSSLDAPLLVPTRQSKFWFQDGSIILHVENATYKVHRSVLESYSSVLRERFSKACHDGIQRSQGEGQVPSVKLEDVSNNDFMQFLALLYPRDFQDRESLTPTQWSSLLTMSHTFQIPSLRKLAISFISSTASDVDKIAFGHMHGVKEWLLPSYDALANRNDPLTVEEGWRLGVDVVVRIAKARELRLTLGERWSEVGGEVLRRIFEDLELPLEGAGIDADM